MEHRTTPELEVGLDHIRQAPPDEGRLELIVRRPAVDEREIVLAGALDVAAGLAGDTWSVRSSTSTTDGSANPARQVTLMNARLAALIGGTDRERWALAGDQLYVDFDLREANVPAGTRLAIGDAVIEITAQPHLGCAKFAARFGREALRFVNSAVGRELHLRGVNAKVVVPGTIRAADTVRKLPA